MSVNNIQPDDILSYWFGELANGWPVEDKNALWFGFSAADDDALRARFGDVLQLALAGALDDWRKKHAVAYIILLDQLTRAIGRGSKAAFAGDEKALAACREQIASGADLHLPAAHCVFLYMPLEHSEDMEVQELSVKQFGTLPARFPHLQTEMENSQRFAAHHSDIIRRFSRFPHRNSILGRSSTPEESAFLTDNPGGFGQSSGAQK